MNSVNSHDIRFSPDSAKHFLCQQYQQQQQNKTTLAGDERYDVALPDLNHFSEEKRV